MCFFILFLFFCWMWCLGVDEERGWVVAQVLICFGRAKAVVGDEGKGSMRLFENVLPDESIHSD